jgi:hypothetical protein
MQGDSVIRVQAPLAPGNGDWLDSTFECAASRLHRRCDDRSGFQPVGLHTTGQQSVRGFSSYLHTEGRTFDMAMYGGDGGGERTTSTDTVVDVDVGG